MCMFLAGWNKRLQVTPTGTRWVDRIASFSPAVPWYFPSKIIWLYVPNGRCTSRIWIWGDDMGISCFPLIPLGFSTDTHLSNKTSVIFLAVRCGLRPLLGTCLSIDGTGRAMVVLLPWCDFPHLSTTWCDFSKSLLCHGHDVTFPAWCDLSMALVLYSDIFGVSMEKFREGCIQVHKRIKVLDEDRPEHLLTPLHVAARMGHDQVVEARLRTKSHWFLV